MDLSIILAISGKSGLYKVITQTKTGVIVESIEDGKKIPVFANDRSSSLEDISVFTVEEDLPLKEVFKKIYEKEDGGKAIDHKANKNDLIKYFESVLPDYDKDRVYYSDMKKVIMWYNLLVDNKMMDFSEEEKEEKEKDSSDKAEGETKEKTSASKDKQKAKPKPKPKTTTQKSKTQKAQPAKSAGTKNRSIGTKQK
ncbi:MAG: DUF5606 domain-containing protein [Bacteroidota bacterium]